MPGPGPRIAKTTSLPRFKRAYKKLDPRIQKAVDDAIKNLTKNPMPPGLRLSKMWGQSDIWKVRVTDNYRMSFKLEGDLAILRNVDTHDELIDHP